MRVAIDALKDEKDEDFVSHLVRMKSFDNDRREELVDLLTVLNDFQGLFRGHFSVSTFEYVHENRLNELRSIESNDFDLSKLIRLCEELNSTYQNQNYLSVAMLVRAILDHVPPIFGFKNFTEVSSNYGGRSLKKSLQNLQNSSRNIADAYLHESIRRKESLPNDTQVDFRNDLDVLLAEIVRILK